MRTYRGPRIDATILGAASLLALALGSGPGAAVATQRFGTVPPPAVAVKEDGAADFVGVWLSANDTVRLDIAADGTYERSIAGRKRVARGTYQMGDTSVLLRDDSGVQTTVIIGDDYLEMAGYRLAKI